MKKITYLLLALLITLSLPGCGGSNDAPSDDYDLDLTQLSSTMVYSEVYNMMTTPTDYLGKQIRMRGNFSVYQDPVTQRYYYACLIADATACCSQGIEFVLADDRAYPDGYPELGTLITVSGTFTAYVENGTTYCQLTNAQMEN